MKSLAVLIFTIGLSVTTFGQTDNPSLPSRQSIEAKKKQLSELQAALEAGKKSSAAQEELLTKAKQQVAELEAQLQAAKKSIEEQQAEIVQLEEGIPEEEEIVAFRESPARKIADVLTANTFVLEFDGTRRQVSLHGLFVDPFRNTEITKAFKKRLVKKTVYVRCANPACSAAYLYGSKDSPSLNTEMIQAGLARVTEDAKFDAAAFLPKKEVLLPSDYGNGVSRSAPGTDVHVRGYYRKDGTYVRPHTRSAPGTKSSSGSSSRRSSGGSSRRR